MTDLFIVYEGIFQDRFISRQIIGETKYFWKVRNTKSLDTAKLKKGSVGTCAFFNAEADAQKVARRYTEKIMKARNHFTETRAALLTELKESGITKPIGDA